LTPGETKPPGDQPHHRRAARETTAVPGMTLDPADTAELAELLQFLADWLTTHHTPLDASLRAFVGNDAYGAQHLRADLDRFTFLLGGNDGEQLFGLLQRQRATRRPRRPDKPKPPPTVIAH
jgi:hypothetical protein